ncbi:TylF/MycF family methyltransferase [Puniceicoccaceae bacterium]|nr:TylF/MycF family methyltransferase [Puniceicoccaceae bacterium]
MLFSRKGKSEKQEEAELRRRIETAAGTSALFEHTLCRPSKLASLGGLAEELLRRGLTGDFVECGVYKGGSAALIMKLLSDDCHGWLYDSFEGLPQPSELDGDEALQWEGSCVGAVEDVMRIMSETSIDASRVTIRKGWFEDSFSAPLPQKIQFLHIDADWYDSVLLALQTFYPLVVPGGLIVLDDFGHWEGCRHAYYDFCESEKIRPLMDRYGNDQAFWFKQQEHNRDGWMHKAL